MNLMMYFVDVYLNTIDIPGGLLLTSPRERDHFVFLDVQKIANGQFSYWVILLAAISALLTVIILFIESEITLLECFKVSLGTNYCQLFLSSAMGTKSLQTKSK